MAKSGTDFEMLVKSIYEEVLAQDNLENIQVIHNASIPGRSGQKHQIDVFWKFRIGGIEHRVAVECKDHSKKISIGKIRDFYGALTDIGNIRGIFVTPIGYQSGAVRFAEHSGILLKTVSEPTQQEIAEHGGISEIILRGHGLCLRNIKESFVFDVDWIKNNTTLNFKEPIVIGGMTDQITIETGDGTIRSSIFDICNHLPRRPENTKDLSHTINYSDGYIRAQTLKHPRLKILSITLTYDTYTEISESHIKYKIMAQNILKDYVTGESYLYQKSITPITTHHF